MNKTDVLLEKLITEIRSTRDEEISERAEMRKSITKLSVTVDRVLNTHAQVEKDMARLEKKFDEKHAYLHAKIEALEEDVETLKRYQYSSYRTRRWINDNWFRVVMVCVTAIPAIGGLYMMYSKLNGKG